MTHKIFTPIQEAGDKRIEDARALLTLLNEHCGTNITMRFTFARGGRANTRLQRFTIPKFAVDNGETYLFYYVIHEFTHCFGQYHNHGEQFKACERGLLSEFNIKIDYAKAYPKALYANGEIAYHK